MKARFIKHEVTANIEFTEHDLEMFKAMSEYEGTAKHFKEITGSRFTLKEWQDFFDNCRGLSQRLMQDAQENKSSLFKRSYS